MNDTFNFLDEFSSDISLKRMNQIYDRFKAIDPAERGTYFNYKRKIAILSNYSTQFLVRALELATATRGISSDVYEADYNNWEMELVNPNAGYIAFNPDVVIISLTTQLLAFREASKNLKIFASKFCELVNIARKRIDAHFLITLPEPLEEEIDQTIWVYSWRKELCKTITERLGESCFVLDMAPLIHKVGFDGWHSNRFFVNGKFYCHPDKTALHADYLAQYVSSLLIRPLKLVIVDLDNTLWGGVVGEVGWENVRLDIEGDGLPYIRLQRLLVDLYEKGVLLAICSKNNKREVIDVFEHRSEMIIKLEHFIGMEINWDNKSQNIKKILNNLNLSPTGIVFLDDSAFERAEIKYAFPEIFVPDFPEDVAELVGELVKTGKFTIPYFVKEDLIRRKSYKDEEERKQEKELCTDLDEYYSSLELTLTPKQISSSNKKRVLELLAKTNQFNLTTRRHGNDEIQKFLNNSDNYCYAYSLRDKFGEYGIIGILLALKITPETYSIDSWAVSCRAIGRTVEYAIFEHLLKFIIEKSGENIFGEYIQTKKNALVRDLYPNLGFQKECQHSDNSTFFKYSVKLPFQLNKFIKLNTSD